jgi:hypothetical protein
MSEINKTKFILFLLTTLIIGIILGYIIAGAKPPVTKTQYVDKPGADIASNITAKRKIENANLTANEAVNISYSDATAWSENASLSEITLESKIFNSQGQSNSWKITYYSKEKKSSYEILIKDGESRGGQEKETSNPLQTMKGEMIDSSKLAESFYASYPENSEIISLKMYYSENDKKFVWTIFFAGGSHTIKAEI